MISWKRCEHSVNFDKRGSENTKNTRFCAGIREKYKILNLRKAPNLSAAIEKCSWIMQASEDAGRFAKQLCTESLLKIV